MVNDFLGPRRFGRLFGNLETFRPRCPARPLGGAGARAGVAPEPGLGRGRGQQHGLCPDALYFEGPEALLLAWPPGYMAPTPSLRHMAVIETQNASAQARALK